MNNNTIIFGILLIILLLIILACCGIKYKKKSSRKFCSNENFDIDIICRKYPLECPTGSYCPTGSSNPTICATGSYCQTPSTQIACISGNYCPEGTVMPNVCDPGFYCPTPSSQISCPPGYFCPLASLTPNICPTGYYCTTGSSYPLFCDIISYCPQGSSFEQPCPTGYVCSASGYVGSQFFFTPINIKRIWSNISISNNGQYQTAVVGNLNNTEGSINVSSDYGKTWNQNFILKGYSFKDVKISGSGQYQMAISAYGDNKIFKSIDYGLNWSIINFPGDYSYNSCLQITSDAKYQILITFDNTTINGKFDKYYFKNESNDYGISWIKTTLTLPIDVSSLFISSDDGTYQIALPNSNRDFPYVSSDKGQTWSVVWFINKIYTNDTSFFFQSASLSSTGQYQIISKGYDIFLSINYGKEWSWRKINVFQGSRYNNISCISMSSSGQYVIIGTQQSDFLYGSTDYGKTWKQVNYIPAYWTGVSISGDGKYSSAVGRDTQIYISKSTL